MYLSKRICIYRICERKCTMLLKELREEVVKNRTDGSLKAGWYSQPREIYPLLNQKSWFNGYYSKRYEL